MWLLENGIKSYSWSDRFKPPEGTLQFNSKQEVEIYLNKEKYITCQKCGCKWKYKPTKSIRKLRFRNKLTCIYCGGNQKISQLQREKYYIQNGGKK